MGFFAAIEIAGSQEPVRSEFVRADAPYYVDILDDDARQPAVLDWILTLPQHAVDRFERRFGPQDAAGAFSPTQQRKILGSMARHRLQLMRNGYPATHAAVEALDTSIAELRAALEPVSEEEIE